MNKVMPSQTSWPHPTSHVQSKQQEDFAEKLRAKPKNESGRWTANPPATRGSATSTLQEKAAPSIVVPSDLDSDSRQGASGFPGPAVDVGSLMEGAATPSIGLLSGTLTWSRVYPEHLVASGYLSMVDTATRDGNGVLSEQAAWVEPDVNTNGSETVASTPMDESNLDAGGAVVASLSDESRQPVNGEEAAALAGPDSEVASSMGALDAAVFADRFWAERLVRLTHDGGGQSTVWLRDYRLKADDFESVAVKLRWHGQQDAIPIGRVVINGREVWRAGTLKEEH